MKLASLVIALACCVSLARAEGPFSDLSFEAATAKAKADGKLLLVDFMASWCPPCKLMDKQTWPDEAVGKWIGEHAIAIQVDIDKETALAQRFAFDAIPTVIFLKDDKELDRQTGFRTPEQFLGWGADVLAGKNSKTAAADKGKALLESDDVKARYDVAEELAEAGQYDLALQHYLWLWPNSRKDSAFAGVRLSFMLGSMAELAERHEPARKAFAGLLDELQAKIDAAQSPVIQDWMDWSAMCGAFHENGRVVAWYEKHRGEDGRLTGLTSWSRIINDGVFGVLISEDRPVDAVRLYQDASERGQTMVTDYTSGLQMLDSLPADMHDNYRDYLVQKCRVGLATLRAAALAAGQADAATKIAAQLLGVLDDADSRLALVERTLDLAPQHTEGLAAWLDQAEKLGADVGELRARLVPPVAAPVPGH